MTSLRLDRPWLFLAALIAAISLLALTSCDIAQEDGHTYLTFSKEAAWEKYDSLEVTWIDTISGAGGILFQGDPGDLKPKNRVLADGYQGQKILILFKGFNGGVLAFEEHRRFDGTPGGITAVIIPVIPTGAGGASRRARPGCPPSKPIPWFPSMTPSTTRQTHCWIREGSKVLHGISMGMAPPRIPRI